MDRVRECYNGGWRGWSEEHICASAGDSKISPVNANTNGVRAKVLNRKVAVQMC
jgi:hypothetical protein